MRSKISLQEEKRKWSDWSECSFSCTKRRHRKNCDDIVLTNLSSRPQHNTTRRIIRTPTIKAGKSEVSVEVSAKNSVSSVKSNEDLHNRHEDDVSDDNEEDDDDNEQRVDFDDKQQASNDLPIDINENDSCENLDASLTIEEVACLGGECPRRKPTKSHTKRLNNTHRASSASIGKTMSSSSNIQFGDTNSGKCLYDLADCNWATVGSNN